MSETGQLSDLYTDSQVSGLDAGNALGGVARAYTDWWNAGPLAQAFSSNPLSAQAGAKQVGQNISGGFGPGEGLGASGGFAGIFGGPAAKTADLQALQRAVELESHTAVFKPSTGELIATFPRSEHALNFINRFADANPREEPLDFAPVSREDIWERTGWFRGPDSKWRFEIPDTGASWKPEALEKSDDKVLPEPTGIVAFPFLSEKKLGDVLEHPQLFEAYPTLKDLPVGSTPLFDAIAGTKGAYDSVQDKMYLTRGKAPDVLSTALHEAQHKIQNTEGFATGGSPSQFLPPGFSEEYNAKGKALEVLRNQVRETGANPLNILDYIDRSKTGQRIPEYMQKDADRVPEDLRNQFHAAMEEFIPFRQAKTNAFNRYLNLAGEVESRTVQERHAQGQYEVPPWNMEGYPTMELQEVQLPEIQLHPVGHNPFQAVPVEHDPFAPGPGP